LAVLWVLPSSEVHHEEGRARRRSGLTVERGRSSNDTEGEQRHIQMKEVGEVGSALSMRMENACDQVENSPVDLVSLGEKELGEVGSR